MLVVLMTLVIGFPVAYLLALKRFPFREIISSLVELPIVLPPLIAGVGLLILLGNNGLVGRIFGFFDYRVLFTKMGIIIAQFFVASPFFIKSVKDAIESIPKELFEMADTMGASSFEKTIYIILPMIRPSIVSGLIISWSRALGEFGATAMVAGSIPGTTETMTLAIYSNSMNGQISSATSIAMILVIFSFFLIAFIKKTNVKIEI